MQYYNTTCHAAWATGTATAIPTLLHHPQANLYVVHSMHSLM